MWMVGQAGSLAVQPGMSCTCVGFMEYATQRFCVLCACMHVRVRGAAGRRGRTRRDLHPSAMHIVHHGRACANPAKWHAGPPALPLPPSNPLPSRRASSLTTLWKRGGWWRRRRATSSSRSSRESSESCIIWPRHN